MSFGNPLALIGLIAVAIPIVVHLLARRVTRVQPFPTLRFLGAAQAMSARRTRPSDILLLLLRALVIALAATALAAPRFGPAPVTGGGRVVRAIIVDTSLSMRRAHPDGGAALDAAARAAADSAASAAESVVLRAASPALAIAGAVDWLGARSGRREVTIVSDFQRSALGAPDVAAIPGDIGVRLVRVGVAGTSAPALVSSRGALTVTALADGSRSAWTVATGTAQAPATIVLLTSADARAAAAASLAAVGATTGLPHDSTRRVAVVFAGDAATGAPTGPTSPIDVPWMGDVAAALLTHALADSVARGAVDGATALVVYTAAVPGSLESARVITSIADALEPPPSAAESDPVLSSDEQLAAWSREPGAAAASSPTPEGSHGGWLWIAALAVLAAEWRLRSAMDRRQAAGVAA